MSRDILVGLIDPDPAQAGATWTPAGAGRAGRKYRGLEAVAVPILLWPVGERFVSVQGERRWRSAQALGRSTIPAQAHRELSAEEALWLAPHAALQIAWYLVVVHRRGLCGSIFPRGAPLLFVSI